MYAASSPDGRASEELWEWLLMALLLHADPEAVSQLR